MNVPKKKSSKRKKKGRLNTRLLMIVGLSALIVAGVGAGLVYLRIKGSVSRNLHAGATYLAENEWKSAQQAYGKAVRKEASNEEGIDGLLAVYDAWIPQTLEHATSLQRQYFGALLHDVRYHPGDDARAIRAMVVAHDEAHTNGRSYLWTALKSLAKNILEEYPPESEAGQEALYYMALSRLATERESFTRERDDNGNVIFPGEVELIAYLEARPGDDRGMAQLAFGRMAVARRLGLEEKFQQEARNLELAEETFRQALQMNPEGPYTLMSYVRHLVVHELVTAARAARQVGTLSAEERATILEELSARLDQVEQILRDTEDVETSLLADYFQFVRIGDPEHGDERVRDLARHHLSERPDDDIRRLELAGALRNLNAFDEAIAEARTVLDAPARSVGKGASRQYLLRAFAAKNIFDIAADHWTINTDPDDRLNIIQEAQAARDDLVNRLQGDTGSMLVVEADGRLAFMKGDYASAAANLERLAKGGSASSTILRIDAAALEGIGQPGLAADRLREAVAAQPGSIGNRALLASLLGRMGQPDEGLLVLEALTATVLAEREDLQQLVQTLQALKIAGSGGDISVLDNPVLEAIMHADALHKNGDIDAALAVLEPILQQDSPEIVGALIQAAQLESARGNRDAALAYIVRADVLRPDNDQIKQIEIVLSIDDPVERLQLRVEQEATNPDERDTQLALALQRLIQTQTSHASRYQQEGNLTKAAVAREIVGRAQTLLDPLIQRVAEGGDASEAGFLLRYETALTEDRFDDAERMLDEAREKNIDKAGGNVLEAELLLRRYLQARDAGNTTEATALAVRAVTTARRGTQEAAWLDSAWRQLGRVLQGTGDMTESRLAWAEAWRRNPTDPVSARVYAGMLLQQGGDPLQAARVLRDAAKENRLNRMLVEDWIRVEYQHGNQSIALMERQRIHKTTPEDRANALQLAGMLVRIEPAYDIMPTNDPRFEITPRQWLSMDSNEQQTRLTELGEQWRSMAVDMLDELAASDDTNIAQLMIHVTVLNDLGRRDALLARLSRFADRVSNDPERDEDAELLSIAQFLVETDRNWEAVEFLRARQDRQGDGRRVDAALGTLLAGLRKPDEALPYLKAAARAGDEASHPRLIELLLQMRRIDDAKAELKRMRGDLPRDYGIAMLDALIARAEQARAEVSGDAAGAASFQTIYRDALIEASRLDAEQVAPYLELISSMIHEYRKTIDRSVLEQALRYADAAAKVRSDVASLAVQRAIVLEALGEPLNAANDLETFLRRNPDSESARVALAQMHIAAGTPDRASRVLEDAIVNGRNPAMWQNRLAEHVFRQSGDRVEATRLIADAWASEPTIPRLDRLRALSLTHDPWSHEAVYAAIGRRASESVNDPLVRGLRARSESAQGLRDHARASLREAWPMYLSRQTEGTRIDSLKGWFEDAYVVFRPTDAAAADAFVDEVVGTHMGPEVLAGRAHFLTLRNLDGDSDQAITMLKQALVPLQGHARLGLLSQLGSAQLRGGKDSGAITTFREVVDLDMQNPVALNNLAWLLVDRHGEAQEALPLARRAVELAPNEPTFIDTMTVVQEALGDHNGAMTSRLSRLRLQPNSPELLKEVALAYLEHFEDAPSATPYAQRVLELVPRDASALDLAGWVDFKSGKTARSEDRLKQSIRRQPTATAHLHLAQVLASKGRQDQARDHLRQAEALASTDEMRDRVAQVRSDLEATR